MSSRTSLVTVAVLTSCALASIDPSHLGLVAYATSSRQCKVDTDCDEDAGEVCYWLYEGCSTGQCMCHPHTHHKQPSGKCERITLGGDHCVLNADCPDTMSCSKGYCSCASGYLAPDATTCLLRHHRLLGQECSSNDGDTCVQRAQYGYTNDEVTCSSMGECVCTDGYKRTGFSCRKWGINERGCSDSYQCHGGAVCKRGYCRCPSGYRKHDNRCAKIGAVTDLSLGQLCDEVNERRYCSPGLVCLRCGNHKHETCIRCESYLTAQNCSSCSLLMTVRAPQPRRLTGSSSSSSSPTFLCLTLATVSSIMLPQRLLR